MIFEKGKQRVLEHVVTIKKKKMMNDKYYLMLKSDNKLRSGNDLGFITSILKDADETYDELMSWSAYIDITCLIEFLLEHQMSVVDSYYWDYGRYKNICEVLIELDEKNLLSEAMKELPELFAEIMEDNHYVKHFCGKYMKEREDNANQNRITV